MKMMVDLAHDFLNDILTPNSIAVDFTMGNGFDTVFLAQRAKLVYAFDKQPEALKHTKQKLAGAHLDQVQLILDGHERAAAYLPHFDAGIFNLGYLPGASHQVTTQPETTLKALRTALDLLNQNGRLVLVVYPGHETGMQESIVLNQFVAALSPHDYHVANLSMANKKRSPYLLIIDKLTV